MPNLHAVGARSVSSHATRGASAYDANSKTRGTAATGTISTPGQWRRMEQTCPAVAAGARALLGVLQGSAVDLKAHEGTPEQIVDYLRECLFERPRQQFATTLESILSAVRYGFAPHEITIYRDAGKIWLAGLEYRPPQTFDLHSCRRLPSGWVEATQRYIDSDGTIKTAQYGEPGRAGTGILLWPVSGGEGALLGEGFYRPLYAIYEEWAEAVNLRRIAMQRASLGALVVTQRDTGKAPDVTALEATEEALGEMITVEKAVVILPQWVESAAFEFSRPEAIDAITGVIQDCETRILQAFGAQYAARGITTQHGSYSASRTDADELRGHRASYASWISQQIQPLIDWLVNLNFGEQRHYPELSVSVPRELTPQDLITAASQAVSAKLLIVDSGVRNNIRLALQQEPEGDEVEDELAKPEPTPPVPPTQPAPDGAPDDTLEDDLDHDDSEPEKGGDVKMTAAPCASCAMTDTVGGETAGVRAAPRPGGRDRRSGPGGRDLSAVERLVRWHVLEMALDTGAATVGSVLRTAQDDVAEWVLGKLAAGEWDTSNEAAELVQGLTVPPAIVDRVARAVMAELRRIADVAAAEVEREHGAQVGTVEFAAKRQIPLWDGDDWGPLTAKQLAAETCEDARNQIVRASISVEAMTRAQVLELLGRAAAELSTMVPDAGATLAATETFARAREAAVERIVEETKSQPTAVWYSAILDENTCEECGAADQEHGQLTGTAIPWGSALHTEMLPPYQRCLGGVRCRCQLIYEWE
jgi:hypothetical protein